MTKEERLKKFMDGYKELTEKFGFDFASFPVFVPKEDGKGGFDVRMQTTPIDLEELKKAQVDRAFISK